MTFTQTHEAHWDRLPGLLISILLHASAIYFLLAMLAYRTVPVEKHLSETLLYAALPAAHQTHLQSDASSGGAASHPKPIPVANKHVAPPPEQAIHTISQPSQWELPPTSVAPPSPVQPPASTVEQPETLSASPSNADAAGTAAAGHAGNASGISANSQGRGTENEAGGKPTMVSLTTACPDALRILNSQEYPPEALHHGYNGNVVIRFIVGVDGSKKHFRLRESAGDVLDDATLDAVKKFHCIGQGRDVMIEAEMLWKLEAAMGRISVSNR